MNQTAEIDLVELWGIAWRRRFFVLIVTAACGVTALVVNLGSPKTYQSQSLVALPEVIKYYGNYDTKVSTFLLTTSETKAYLDFLRREPGVLDSDQLKKLKSVSIDEIRGSNVYFKMTVTARDDPNTAVALSRTIIEYLQNRPEVKNKIDNERRDIETYLRETDQAIARDLRVRDEVLKLLKTRDPVGFNPVDVEVSINALKGTNYQLRTALSQLHSFRFVKDPTLEPIPVGPRTLLSTVIYTILGLLIGIAASLLHHTLLRSRADSQ